MRKRVLEFFLPLAFFMLFDLLYYNLIGAAVATRGVNYAPCVALRLDTAFPFMSVFIVPYVFTWILPLLAVGYLCFIARTDVAAMRQMYAAFAVLNLLHCVLWFAVPVKTHFIIRDFVGEQPGNILDQATVLMHAKASLWNSLPAMHVATPWFIYRVAGLHARRWRHALLAMCILIAISTLAIKIHYVLDGLIALLCAELTFRVVFLSSSLRGVLARMNATAHNLAYAALTLLLLVFFFAV